MADFDLSDEEWKKRLSKEEYHVLREKGTELPFTGKNLSTHEDGIFLCKACSNPLFDSHSKFESGSGWPSFTAPIQKDSVEYHEDYKLSSKRIEVCCAKCHCHLGHVFDDGPAPSNKRFCVNSIALNFNPKKE